MYTHTYGSGSGWLINSPLWVAPFAGLVLVAVLWTIVWKGFGLWHSARNGDHWWFIAMLVLNTLGILEIIYLFFIAKMKFDQLMTKGPHHHAHHDHTHHSH